MKRTNKMFGAQFLATGGLNLIFGICLMLLSACTLQAEQPKPDKSPNQPMTSVMPEVTGEVPADLINEILDDLVKFENVSREEIEVVRAESVIWPDGALGCARPDEMYTHVQVPGFWVVLRVGNRQYDYRASEKGSFRRCNNSVRRQVPVG